MPLQEDKEGCAITKKIVFCVICLISLIVLMAYFFPIYSSMQKPVASYQELAKELAGKKDIVLPTSDSTICATEYLLLLDGRSRSANVTGYSISGVSEANNMRILRSRTCEETGRQMQFEQYDSEGISGEQNAGQNGNVVYKGINILTSVTNAAGPDHTGRITLWNEFSINNYTYYFSDTYMIAASDDVEITERYIETIAGELLADSYQIIDAVL